MAADLGDRGRAEDLAFADEQQAVRAVDPGREHHAGLEFLDEDLAYLPREIDELRHAEEEAHGLRIVVAAGLGEDGVDRGLLGQGGFDKADDDRPTGLSIPITNNR